LVTLSASACSLNTAVTDRAALAALIAIVQLAPDTVSHPVQPSKIDPAAGEAVSVTAVPVAYVSEQSAPQVIPSGLEVTVPPAVPVRLTESVRG
jgi:hypothetical protein